MNTPEDQAIIEAALRAQREKQIRESTINVTPSSGVLPVRNLKSVENWRAFFHSLVGVVVPLLVTLNITTSNVANAWIPFVFAILDNVLSVGNTVDKVRKAVYAGAGAIQSGGLLTVLLSSTAPEWIPVGSALLAVGSSFLARFYTPTTTMNPANER